MAKRDTAALLTESAFELFSKRGISSVSIDAIAENVGVTKGSAYWHYKSKDEIILGGCEYYYAKTLEHLRATAAAGTTAAEMLKLAIRDSVQTCLIDEANRIFTMEIFTLSLYNAQVRTSWARFFEDVREFYKQLYKQAAKEAGKSVSAKDTDRAVNLMLSAMEGYKLRAIYEPDLCKKGAEKEIASHLISIIGL